ncbi:MAG: gamma-glutamyl-gamma-aminobutyrate hydrolase family protein [Bacteriovoracia bacterium]
MKAHGRAIILGLVICFDVMAGVSCKGEQSLVVGHTYALDWITRFRLANSARELGHEVSFRPITEATQLDAVDALLIPGGADIHPDLYSTPALEAQVARFRQFYRPSPEGPGRDKLELAVWKRYFSDAKFQSLPALGICRGMQMMAVAQGVPLVQDLEAELGIKNRNYSFDTIKVTDQQSIVAGMFPEGEASGLKIHHQNPSMRYLASAPLTDLKVTATSLEGKLSEAIESVSRPAIGLQIHPEKSFPTVKHRVFQWLLAKACERKSQGDSL